MTREDAIFEIECADDPQQYSKAIDFALDDMRRLSNVLRYDDNKALSIKELKEIFQAKED